MNAIGQNNEIICVKCIHCKWVNRLFKEATQKFCQNLFPIEVKIQWFWLSHSVKLIATWLDRIKALEQVLDKRRLLENESSIHIHLGYVAYYTVQMLRTILSHDWVGKKKKKTQNDSAFITDNQIMTRTISALCLTCKIALIETGFTFVHILNENRTVSL